MFDIITDSACDLTPDTAKQLGVEVVPFYVSLDGEHYRKEGKEITVRDYGRVIARGDGKAIRNNPKVIAAYLGGD